MKNRQRGNSTMFFTVMIFVALISGSLALDSASCTSKWEDSGFATRWGPIKGCVIQVPSGKWLPENVVREVDLNAAPKEALNESKK